MAQIDDYLLPRLRSDGAPLLVVVGGSTGAGKSTLVNSLLGEKVTTPGVLRPTTRSPVLVHHPGDAPWFGPERILPNLPRLHGGESSTPGGVRLAPHSGMPPGLALLDAPDIDSVESANRELASQLLAAADLWLFVTTAARYADAVPWELLTAAAARHAQIALVIDRIDPGAEEVVDDLRRLAAAEGLASAPLFAIPEEPLGPDGLLPERAIAEVAAWLTALGSDALARTSLARATRDGVLADLAQSLNTLASSADAQAAARDRLTQVVESAYDEARLHVTSATRDGAMLRGEVLARWQDFVGASTFMRGIERGVSTARDRISDFFRGNSGKAAPVETAIVHGLESITRDAVESARARTRSLWRADPAGAPLIAEVSGVTGAEETARLHAAIAEQIRGWQKDVLDLVGDQAAGKRSVARGLSFGVNGLGVALMLVTFGSTGGLTGIEIGVAGGTAVVAQKMLEAVFGEEAMRRLATQAAQRLDERLGAVIDADRDTALTVLVARGIAEDAGEELRQAAAELAAATAADDPAASPRPPAEPGRHAFRGSTAARVDLSHDGTQELPSASEPKRKPWWQRLFGGDAQ